MLAPWKKSYDQPRQSIKKQRHYFANKVRLVKAMVFPVVMYRFESWTIKKAECWSIDAFELWCWRRLLESPLDFTEIQPVHPKGNQSWIFIGRTDPVFLSRASLSQFISLHGFISLKSLLSPASCFWRWWGPRRCLREQSPNTSSSIYLFVNSFKGTRSPIGGILIKTTDSSERKALIHGVCRCK